MSSELDLGDPTAVALAIFCALQASRIEATLFLFKVLSTRDRDLEDAATVLRSLGPQLDRPLIDAEAARLAAEIPDHDVAGRLARLGASG